MHILIAITPLLAGAVAIWPQPKQFDHGDIVLCMKKDVPIEWYKTGDQVGGLITEQFPSTLASDLNIESKCGVQHGKLKLRQYITMATLEQAKSYSANQGVAGDDIVNQTIRNAWKAIFDHGLYPWKFHPRNWSEPSIHHESPCVSSIKINQLCPDPPGITTSPAGSIDESYSIELGISGTLSISANTSIGIAHGLTTLTQLFYTHSNKVDIYTPLAPLKIFDSPTFSHRGINLDVSRHFFPVSVIKRQMSAAAYNKMNRFHLHVTDGQSWPLEIPSLPELSAKGAYRPDLVYTTDDFDELQRHAALLGMQLITEIDMPGHTSSIAHAYPHLIAAFERQPNWDMYAAEPPSGTLKLNSSEVDKFLDTLFADLLPRVENYSHYFHTGGDEVNMNAYTLDETVKSSDFNVLKPLMQQFIDKNHERVRKKGLTPVVWEEMLLQWDLKLGDDVVVQSWQSDEAVKKIVERGHKALVGNYQYWVSASHSIFFLSFSPSFLQFCFPSSLEISKYSLHTQYLDCGKGQWLNFDPSVSSSNWPYNDYCAPYHNWRLAYSYDPLAGVSKEYHNLVIGGEAHMWAEQTDPVNVDQMIWPRGSAVAEILWSGAKDEQGRNRSQIEASPRLSEMRERLVSLGVGAEPIQMPYCTMEGTVCQLGWER